MQLRELKVGHEAKCTCEICRGAGVYKNYASQDGLAIVCNACNGKGYYTLKINDRVVLMQDQETGVIFKVKDAILDKPVEIFRGLKKRDDVEFVTYSIDRATSVDGEIEKGSTAVNIIDYEDFLDGCLPLPTEVNACPRQFTQFYGADVFDNTCPETGYSNCPKYQSGKCWDLFYGTATTPEEIQSVLRKVR